MSMATEACVGLCKCGNKASVGLCMALLCYVWPGAMQACVVFVSQCRLVHGYVGQYWIMISCSLPKKTWSSSCN